MKRFKTRKKSHGRIDFVLLIIAFTTLFILHFYNTNISPKIVEIASSKLEEITTIYIKKDIVPTVDLDELITINLNSAGEIIYVDIDHDYANEIMVSVVGKIQNNILELEKGNIKEFQNSNELKNYNGNLYLSVPIGLAHNGYLFSNLGPKIPIRISFFEHVLGNIDTTITEYGINNALLKVYMTVSLEQKLMIPYKSQTFTRDYSLVLGSKVIIGTVPSIYGPSLKTTSPILES